MYMEGAESSPEDPAELHLDDESVAPLWRAQA